MMKERTSATSYRIVSARTDIPYLVTMNRTSNTNSGNPRFEVSIIPLIGFGLEGEEVFNTYNFLYHGHYMSERQEAERFVQDYESYRFRNK